MCLVLGANAWKILAWAADGPRVLEIVWQDGELDGPAMVGERTTVFYAGKTAHPNCAGSLAQLVEKGLLVETSTNIYKYTDRGVEAGRRGPQTQRDPIQ